MSVNSCFKRFVSLAVVAVFSVFIASCGSGSSVTGYNVELVDPAMGYSIGKSAFQLKVTNKSDGSPATGLASQITLYPLMHMSTMNHSTPVPVDAVTESSTPGYYDCTVFFVMATMSDTEYWELQVKLNGETTSFKPNVGMSMDSDTVRAVFKNNNDMIMSMSSGTMSARYYYAFKDEASVGTHGGEFTVFIATMQEGLMTFPPLVAGMTIMDMNNQTVQMTINSIELSVSVDGMEWEPMACDSNSRCSAHVHEFEAGVTTTVYVKMSINGNAYTTDGSSPNGSTDVATSNEFATFTVTPASSSM